MIVVHDSAQLTPDQGAPTVHVVPDVAAAAGPWVMRAVSQVIERTGRCRLALAGGSTPGPTYRWLRDHLPHHLYGQLWVTLSDERALRYDALQPEQWADLPSDSNLRLVMEHWLAHVPMDPKRILPMTLGGPPEGECVRFGREFLRHCNGEIDVAVLGVGADGHIASLFADHPALEVDDVCLLVQDSPKPPAQRISLTGKVLHGASHIVVLAEGEAKATVLAAVYQGDRRLPVGRLLPHRDLHWVIDKGLGQALFQLLWGVG